MLFELVLGTAACGQDQPDVSRHAERTRVSLKAIILSASQVFILQSLEHENTNTNTHTH